MFLRILFLTTLMLTTAQTAHSTECVSEINSDFWIELTLAGTEDSIATYLKKLRKCLKDNEEAQLKADTAANSLLRTVPWLAEKGDKERKLAERMANFTKKAFKLAAQAGFPSAQHNYGALHNLPKEDPAKEFFKQDYDTYVYWMRKAAAQKEERALFNLASRFAIGLPEHGVEQNLPQAYILYKHIEASPFYETELAQLIPYIQNKQHELREILGAEKIAELDKNWQDFNFKSLIAKKYRSKK